MNIPAKALSLTVEDREVLEICAGAYSTPQQVAKRARIILLAAEGIANTHIADMRLECCTSLSAWNC